MQEGGPQQQLHTNSSFPSSIAALRYIHSNSINPTPTGHLPDKVHPGVAPAAPLDYVHLESGQVQDSGAGFGVSDGGVSGVLVASFI